MSYQVHCECQNIKIECIQEPIVHAYCHCSDCRDLLDTPYHSVTAWKKEDVKIIDGIDKIKVFQHPCLKMQKHFCGDCGEVVFNTNGMDWRIVSQLLITKCYDGQLPKELASDKHFFYEQRVVKVNDNLPKYLRGTSGPLFEEV